MMAEQKKLLTVSMILIAVFCLGLLAGASGALYLTAKPSPEDPPNRRDFGSRRGPGSGGWDRERDPQRGPGSRNRGGGGGPGPGDMTRFLERRMTGELDLTDEQRTLVRQELKQLGEEMHQVREQVAPKMKEAFDKAKQRIAAHLNETQRAKFEQQENLFDPRGSRGWGGGPGGRRPHSRPEGQRPDRERERERTPERPDPHPRPEPESADGP